RNTAERVAGHDSAERSRDRNRECGTEAEDIFENQISGEEEQELVGNGNADDAENERRKDAKVSVMADPDRQHFSIQIQTLYSRKRTPDVGFLGNLVFHCI